MSGPQKHGWGAELRVLFWVVFVALAVIGAVALLKGH